MQILPLQQDPTGPNRIQTAPGDYFPFAEIAATAYYEPTYSGSFVTGEAWYEDNTKAVILRSVSYTYSGSRVTVAVWEEYRNGVVWSTITDIYTYSGSRVDNIERVQS